MNTIWKLLTALGMARRTWSVTDSGPRVYDYKLGRKRVRKVAKARAVKVEPQLPFTPEESLPEGWSRVTGASLPEGWGKVK